MTVEGFPEVRTLDELLDEDFGPVRFIVKGLLPCGLTAVVAKSKIGKSWLLLTIAVAAGMKNRMILGGSYEVQPSAVLYLDLELAPRGSQKRAWGILKRVGATKTGERPLVFFIANDWPKIDAQPDGLEQIERFLDAHPCDLVVIDTIAKLYPPALKSGGRNSYYAEYDLFSRLKRLADSRNIAIVILHHESKSGADDPLDRISGSAALPAVADAIWVLSRERNEKNEATESGTLYVTGREVEERTVEVAFSGLDGWTVVNDPENRA